MKAVHVIIGAVVLFLVGLGSFIVLGENAVSNNKIVMQVYQQPTPIVSNSVTPTPQITPVTTLKAQQMLSITDTTIQSSLNQVDSQLNDLNNVNMSQDTTSNL